MLTVTETNKEIQKLNKKKNKYSFVTNKKRNPKSKASSGKNKKR